VKKRKFAGEKAELNHGWTQMNTDFFLRLERNAELTLIKFPRTLRGMAKKSAEAGSARRADRKGRDASPKRPKWDAELPPDGSASRPYQKSSALVDSHCVKAIFDQIFGEN
jgi:hypothetical protein